MTSTSEIPDSAGPNQRFARRGPAGVPTLVGVEDVLISDGRALKHVVDSTFLQVGGADVEGTLFPTGPGVVARELPDDNPVKKVAVAFADKYEAQYGAHTLTQFAGDAYGAWMLLDSAVARARKTGAKPGTPAFRAALRDALENTRDLIVTMGC